LTGIFTLQPADFYGCEGPAATFTASTDAGTYTYQWQINSITGWTDLSEVGVYSGVTTNTLNISSTTGLMGSEYQLVATGTDACLISESTITVSLNELCFAADLSLTKTSNESSIYVDEQLVFTITVTNDGPATATGVQVTDTLSTEFITYVSDDSGGNYVPATGIWTIGSIASGASVSLNITVTGIKVGNP
ncbi:MAG: DUF11 domain-containing protein, partial [Gammaproteobacteria bacterium]|nr:DUF11 domain-containing protein [Gammaproteobacteria bacterium]